MAMQLKFRARRGPRARLPDLLEGEFGFASDTHELFIGTATAANVQVGTSGEIDAKMAAHRVEAGAHDVARITGAETPAGAQAKVEAHAAASPAHNVSAITGAETPAGAQAKVDAHAVAGAAHDVAAITGAVSGSYLSANHYTKAESDVHFMPDGMSPVVAAIIFGG